MDISVVVCTYNRADLLREVLRDLCNQDYPKSQYEILVVDNNSIDNTRNIIEAFCKQYQNVRYILETHQGHTYARNRGWLEAKGSYVGYVDDDCQLPPQWVKVAEEVIKHIAPAAFGGPYFPLYKSPKPPWFKDRYASRYVSDNVGREARPLKQDEYLDGMNIFFRRSMLQELNGFKNNLGMSGKKIGYGDETELLMRIRKVMPTELIYYEPKLFVHHLVRPEKMTLCWIVRSFFADGQYYYRITHPEQPPIVGYRRLFRQTIDVLKNLGSKLILGLFKRDREQYPYLQNYFYECTSWYWHTLGKLYEQYQNRRNT